MPFKDVTERRKEFVVGILDLFSRQSSSARGLTSLKDVQDVTERRKEFVVGILDFCLSIQLRKKPYTIQGRHRAA